MNEKQYILLQDLEVYTRQMVEGMSHDEESRPHYPTLQRVIMVLQSLDAERRDRLAPKENES